MNSKDKGKRGEREFRDLLRAHGYLKARRGCQFEGGSDSPDVVCPELPQFHFEVKRCERGSIYDWINQAHRDKGGATKLPAVAHKRNHSEWLIVLPESVFFEILRRSDLPVTGTGGPLEPGEPA